MASNYPASLDTFSTLVDNTDFVLALHPNDRGDAIENLEIKVGRDNSDVITTIDYFLKHATGAYRNHVHDGSSDDGAALPDYTRTKPGDLISSTVNTARTGWTNVSVTYSNRFMRINATPLSTSGVDTHTHTGGSFTSTTGSHTLSIAQIPGHSHTKNGITDIVANFTGGGSTLFQGFVAGSENTGTTGSGGGHTHTGGSIGGTSAAGNNVPTYLTVCLFQKD